VDHEGNEYICWIEGTAVQWLVGILTKHISCNSYRLNVCVPLQFINWNLSPQWDGIRKCGHWEVIRSWGWSPHEWDQCPYERTDPRELPHPFYQVKTWREDGHLWTRKRAWTLNLYVPWSGTFGLQNCEKLVSVVYKPLNLWYSVLEGATDQDTNWMGYQRESKNSLTTCDVYTVSAYSSVPCTWGFLLTTRQAKTSITHQTTNLYIHCLILWLP